LDESKLERRDHTAVGGMQIASKAMEIWFYDCRGQDHLRCSDNPHQTLPKLPLAILAMVGTVHFGDIFSLAE
jgi:hypothetical protein